MTSELRQHEPTARDRAGARALDRAIDPARLPPYVPGEPWGLAAAREAVRAANEVLDALGEIYGVRVWDDARFQHHIVEGTLRAWRPETRVTRDGDTIRIESPTCPLLVSARLDPRACHLCRLTQTLVATTASDGAVEAVRSDAVITRGDDACVSVIHRRGARPDGRRAASGQHEV